MTDLIERLRDPNVIYMTREAAAEAADEIERLQAWKDEHSRTEGGECPYCEIERLRAALQQIVDYQLVSASVMIAKEALAAVQGEDDE